MGSTLQSYKPAFCIIYVCRQMCKTWYVTAKVVKATESKLYIDLSEYCYLWVQGNIIISFNWDGDIKLIGK